jgi:hypothetical protein
MQPNWEEEKSIKSISTGKFMQRERERERERERDKEI